MFATWPIVGKIALRAIPSLGLVAFRVVGASLALVLVARFRGSVGRIERRDWPLLVLSGTLGVVLNQWLFVKGLSLTTVINSTLLGTTIPVFTLLVGIVLRTDRASLAHTVGIALAAGGVLCLIGPQRVEFSSATLAGDFYIILVPTVGAYYLNAWALARVPPSTVAVYIYLQPLIAFALATLLLDETLSWRAVIASGLIFAGVLVVTRGARNRAIQKVARHPEAFGH